MTAELRCNAATEHGCPNAFLFQSYETPRDARWTHRRYPNPPVVDRCPDHPYTHIPSPSPSPSQKETCP